MQIARASALLFSLSLLACGDDGGGHHLIDSGIGNTDTPPKVCDSVSLTTDMTAADVTGETAGSFLSFYSELNEMIDGKPAAIYIELYHSVIPSITGTIDLAAAPQNSYADCGVCVYALTFDPSTGALDKFLFQQAGSVTFSADPITARHLTATFAGLKLQEAEVDANTGDQTFNPQGVCSTIASATFDQDNIPNDWTCNSGGTNTWYTGAGGACDCSCGAYDKDCRTIGATLNGCTGTGKACAVDATTGDVCVTKPINDTCAMAELLPVGTAAAEMPVTASTAGADRNYNMGLETASCTKYRKPGPEIVYKVVLTAGTTYTAKLTAPGEDFDGSIAIVGPDAALDGAICNAMPIATCVAGTDEGYAGDDESVAYTPGTTGTYYVIIDSYDTDGMGGFTLAVDAP